MERQQVEVAKVILLVGWVLDVFMLRGYDYLFLSYVAQLLLHSV